MEKLLVGVQEAELAGWVRSLAELVWSAVRLAAPDGYAWQGWPKYAGHDLVKAEVRTQVRLPREGQKCKESE